MFAQNFGLPEDEMRKHPHALFGDVPTICEELERRREAYGISYITVGEDNIDSFAPVVERLSGQIAAVQIARQTIASQNNQPIQQGI